MDLHATLRPLLAGGEQEREPFNAIGAAESNGMADTAQALWISPRCNNIRRRHVLLRYRRIPRLEPALDRGHLRTSPAFFGPAQQGAMAREAYRKASGVRLT